MANQVSPGVIVKETSLTGIIPSVSSSIGAIAGVYNWGPVGEVVLVDSEKTLVERFGKPSNRNAETWFVGANFLAYGDKLYVSRGANTSDSANGTLTAYANTNTVDTSSALVATVKNRDDYIAKTGTFNAAIRFLAKYPGDYGNSLRVSVCDTAEQYASSISLSNTQITGTLNIAVGSSQGTINIVPVGNTNISVANTQATTVISKISIGDLISVGNSSIGTQMLKITSFDSVPTSNSTVVTFNVKFEAPYRLRSNNASEVIERKWEFSPLVTLAPGTSTYTKNFGNSVAKDELHVVVIDDGGKFTGVPGTVLETFRSISRATDAKSDNNTSIYYKDVLNNQSQYIWFANDRTGAVSNTATSVVTATTLASANLNNMKLAGGRDGDTETSTNLAPVYAAYEKFTSTDEFQVDFILTGKSIGGIMGEQLPNFIIDNVVEIRQDCIPFISLPYSVVVNNKGKELADATTFAGLLRDTSYRFTDSGYKYQEDRYNGVYRWIPLNGDIAGLAARTDVTKDPWWSFAGFNRGQIKNSIKLSWSPSKPERDIIYPLNINPVVTFQGQGTFLYGDKTGLRKADAFDRINVRRLFIVLERAIAKAAKYSLFEFNDAFTRAQFKNMIVPYLKSVQGRRGITDFVVVCDESNNTGDVIDRNEFVADIYIKPNRSINYITLNFVAVGTSVSFNTVIGQF